MNHLTRIIPLLALLLLLGMTHCAQAQAPAPAATPIVRAVEVRGFQQVSPSIQQSVMNMVNALVNQPFDQDKANKTVEQIQDLGSFANASVSQEPVANGIKLIFTVTEYRVIDQIRFVGNTVYTEAQLRAVIKSQPGEVLNQNQASNDAIAIRETYAKAGYTLSEVIDVRIEADPETKKNTLIFEIFEPRISEIRIMGAIRTREYVIRRQLEFKVGEVYNAKKISSSLLNLNRLGIFQDVTATPETGVQVGTVRVNINIVEKRTGTAAIGVAQSSGANNAGLSGFISISDTNLIGTGQRLSLSLRFGAENSYELSYTNPWIDRQRTSTTVNIYNRRIIRQAFLGNLSPSTLDYYEERRGGDITVGRPISQNTRLFLGFRVNNISGRPSDQTAFDQLIADNPADAPIFQEIVAKSAVRSLSLTAVHDSRFPFLKPFSGVYTSLGMESAGLILGGAAFSKYTGEIRKYFIMKRGKEGKPEEAKLPKHWVYATRLMVGGSTGVPPFLDQFQLGGADTLRGYKDDRFPGETMALWNHELRIPITEALDVVGFFDAGDAWGGRFARFIVDDRFTLHYGYGGGIRVQTPIGPLRLDYGINDEGGSEFTFGVGPTF